MRTIAAATLIAALASPVHAQQVNTLKASGANAAGACAGSFEILAQNTCAAPDPDLQRLAAYTKARDFFATMPQFPAADIEAAGRTFTRLMFARIVNAQSPEIRQAVQQEVLDVANKCVASTDYALKLTREVAYCPTAPGEPLPTQPMQTQPFAAQPYGTEPLALDPIVPVQ